MGEMKKFDKELAIEMRREGKTFNEIGEHFGVSKQYVAQELKNSVRARKSAEVFSQIPYKGLYEFIHANKYVTIPRLVLIMGMSNVHANQEKVRRLLLGRDVFLSKHAFDSLIANTGMTYEYLFEMRDGFCQEEV